ncbi:RNA polymerase sigma factor [Pseudodesulfovibrio pelocollis]|uniref:RNA polymerase sigma factor n=1 Tax=Pseudodesulfovibrio pelocollis TaxID=3051432 RepID=UPI00255A71A8|nr:sigma-70 family RNA polymerase sigma factor [Pseudodesulfovibrio sp. SB368]
MDESREAEIISDVLQGDVQAFEALVRAYQGPVYALMLRYVGDVDVAADLAQEAFTRAYARLETFSTGKRFFPWLYSLALNVSRDWMRRNGRDRHVFMDDAAGMVRVEDRPDERQAMDDQVDGAKAFDHVMGLAPKYREALLLRFRYDFSMQEIAGALGITTSGAKMRVSRGLEMVRERFTEVNDGHER